ncbi:MAG: helix-turn-helix domain-containing protein [Eubacterium sp.]
MDTLINSFEKKTKTENTDLSSLHFHNGYELIFVTKGEVEIEIDCIPHKAQSPAIILLNPFEQHKITGESEDYERCVLVLNADILEQSVSPRLIAMLKCRPRGFSHIVNPNENSFINICEILNSISSELNGNNLFEGQYLLNCVYNLLIIMYRTENNNPDFSSSMMKIQAYIDENYAHIESVGDIAEKFCISLPHLSRSFKAFSGYSPVEYLKNTRLYHAQQMLIYSDYRINEISNMIGFRESNNFIRQFKNKFGISPRGFRNKILGNIKV